MPCSVEEPPTRRQTADRRGERRTCRYDAAYLPQEAAEVLSPETSLSHMESQLGGAPDVEAAAVVDGGKGAVVDGSAPRASVRRRQRVAQQIAPAFREEEGRRVALRCAEPEQRRFLVVTTSRRRRQSCPRRTTDP